MANRPNQMKPLGSPIRNDWKHDFYQSVDFGFALHSKIRNVTQDSLGIERNISNELYDQLVDELQDSIVMFSSFFSVWRHTGFNHGFSNRLFEETNRSYSSFLQDW